MAYNRSDRLSGALKKKISEIIQTQIRDPRIGFVTITDVQVSKDLRHVKVFFSVIGSEKDKTSAIIGLQRATPFIRHMIAQEVELRFTPTIVFKFDETAEYAQHINELLEKIKKQESEKNEEKRDE